MPPRRRSQMFVPAVTRRLDSQVPLGRTAPTARQWAVELSAPRPGLRGFFWQLRQLARGRRVERWSAVRPAGVLPEGVCWILERVVAPLFDQTHPPPIPALAGGLVYRMPTVQASSDVTSREALPRPRANEGQLFRVLALVKVRSARERFLLPARCV